MFILIPSMLSSLIFSNVKFTSFSSGSMPIFLSAYSTDLFPLFLPRTIFLADPTISGVMGS